MSKIAVVTTFHEAGLKSYAQRMINTFCKNWPHEVKLYLYPERCNPQVPDHSRIVLTSLDDVAELTAFKKQWYNVPKANGDVSTDPIRSKRKDAGKGFKWNAIRFAHKTYAIFDCAKKTDADVLIWMDADTVCHNKIDIQTIERLIPSNTDLCYLGRHGKFSECGLYSMNLRTESTRNFLRKFQEAYDHAENGIFQMAEWHDSFVFDEIRKTIPNLMQHNWSIDLKDIRPRPGNTAGEGHPLINTEWGKYLDHLKGDARKKLGKSKKEDLKINHNQLYWQTAR
jgi:hypothetical protein